MSELVLENGFELPTGWSYSIIQDMIDFDGLFTDGDWVETKDQDPHGNVRLIQLADIGVNIFKNKSNRFMTNTKSQKLNCTFLQNNDILIARMPEPLGRACLFPSFDQKCVTVVDIAIIRTGKNGCNPHWLMYIINSPQIQTQILSLQSGTTRKRISKNNLSKLLFPIPPIHEQKRIVNRVERLFTILNNIIDLIKNIQLQLIQYRHALLKYTFEGKLTENWRKSNNCDLESELKIIRQLNDENIIKKYKSITEIPENISKLHKIPKDWNWIRLGFLSKLITKGSSPKWQGIKYVEDGILFVTSENVGTGKILLNKPKFLETKFNEIEKRSILQKGDILTNIVGGSIGRTAIFDLDKIANINQAVSLIRTYDKINQKYIQHVLNSPFLLSYMTLEKVDVARANLSLQNVSNFPIPFPCLNEQEEIVSTIEDSFSLIQNSENIINSLLRQLDSIKFSILKQAFEGKLVPQDPNDKSAKILLQKIKQEKEEHEEKIKQEKQQLKQKASRSKKNVK